MGTVLRGGGVHGNEEDMVLLIHRLGRHQLSDNREISAILGIRGSLVTFVEIFKWTNANEIVVKWKNE